MLEDVVLGTIGPSALRALPVLVVALALVRVTLAPVADSVHVLLAGAVRVEPPLAGIALVVWAAVAGRVAMILAGAPASWEGLAAGPALEVLAAGHVAVMVAVVVVVVVVIVVIVGAQKGEEEVEWRVKPFVWEEGDNEARRLFAGCLQGVCREAGSSAIASPSFWKV